MIRVLSRRCAKAVYVNPRVVEAQYAVRGAIPTRAQQIKEEMAAGKVMPFKELIFCNIGNPQALQQKPLTFYRQVLALVDAPFLLDDAAVTSAMPADVVERAREYLRLIGPMTGAYTDSQGYRWAREAVAQFIARRDGTPATVPDVTDVVLSEGASTGVRLLMTALVGAATDGVMIPIPQYPLYTAQIALLGGTMASYYLDEERGWDLNAGDLTAALEGLKAKGVTPRLLVVINPGNPTGNVLSRETMESVVRFCHDNDVLLLADEVYQENVYASNKAFHSFRKVVLEMPAPYNQTTCVSLHSTSKGIIGECGRRGGYFEMLNVPTELKQQIVKLCSIQLCPNVNGQVTTALMCTPPAEGGASHALFRAEYDAIFSSLRERAGLLARELNAIEGVRCCAVEGAMYAFPTITLPAKYVARCEALSREGSAMAVDARWAMELLERSGVVVVPGSGFLQRGGTLHFRTTILPPTAQMVTVTKSIRDFMQHIYREYA